MTPPPRDFFFSCLNHFLRGLLISKSNIFCSAAFPGAFDLFEVSLSLFFFTACFAMSDKRAAKRFYFPIKDKDTLTKMNEWIDKNYQNINKVVQVKSPVKATQGWTFLDVISPMQVSLGTRKDFSLVGWLVGWFYEVLTLLGSFNAKLNFRCTISIVFDKKQLKQFS